MTDMDMVDPGEEEKDRSDSDVMNPTDAIVSLNVGGTKFTTSKQTLTWIADSFFTSLLSGRIPTLRDETGAIFIDRDPQLFQQILNYLRTKQIDLSNVNIIALKHEAQYYGLTPLVKRLVLCTELDQCACGDVLFHGYLPPPAFPISCQSAPATIHANSSTSSGNSSFRAVATASISTPSSSTVRNSTGNAAGVIVSTHSRNLSEPPILPSFNACNLYQSGTNSGNGGRIASTSNGSSATATKHCLPSMEAKFQVPYAAAAAAAMGQSSTAGSISSSHSYAAAATHHPTPLSTVQSSTAVRPSYAPARGHNRASSADMKHWKPTHRSRGSSDLTRILKQELSNALKYQQEMFMDPYRVQMIRGHHNWIAVAYSHYVACYRMKDSVGWQLAYVSNRFPAAVRHIALNAKSAGPGSGAGGPGAGGNGGQATVEKLLALALSNQSISLFSVNEDGISNQLGVFTLSVPVDTLFFIGGQLVALSKTGKVGIWHGMTGNWQAQDVLVPISSYDTAGSFLLLGCTNGSIYYIDMQKFPLRMKDNDLLVSELYRDPSGDAVTSISVYLTPKSSLCGNWIEIAYGTSAGTVRVIVQHPETVGHSPQLFQTFAVHRAPITNVALTTNHLISVCSEYNHVRTWTVTRFRGMISTQPGSTPLASFKVLTLEAAENYGTWASSGSFVDDVGPFGDQDGDQVFVQKIVPETDQLFVRLASNGERICIVKSVDGSSITSYLVHECEGSSRMGARPRRYLFTGHSNGSIQMWDLSTGLEMHAANRERPGSTVLQGPTPNELLQLIDECEITCNSLSTTPGGTPAGSMAHLPGSSLS